jgi:repressor LexA
MRQRACAQDFGSALELLSVHIEPGRPVPLVGVIAAGRPFETFAVRETLEVARGTWKERNVFALRVRGHSMHDDGIFDGDYLLIEPRVHIRDGQTVVADVDGQPTVKRFYREPDGGIRLQPANDALLPFILTEERVTVRGVVVGVLRKHGFKGRARRPTKVQPRAVATADNRTLDLALRIVQHNLAEWERVARPPAGERTARDVAELGASLRALHDTYAATENPRLRRALLEEAAKISRRMRAVAARLRWVANLRPLPV